MSDTITVLRGDPGSPVTDTIGWLELGEPQTFRRSYEVAAWHTDIEVPAGRYEVRTNGYYVFASLPGVIVSSFTPSLFGGVAVGSSPQGKDHRDVGKDASYGVQTYAYGVAHRIVDSEDPYAVPFMGGVLRLAPGYGARPHTFTSSIDGREITTHQLVKF